MTAAQVKREGPWWLLLGVIVALPLLSLWGHPDWALANPRSELPVKLWASETFLRVGLLSGRIDNAGFPNLGLLNNPDPVGTLVTALLRPLVGRLWAYNLLVWLQLWATALATWALVRSLLPDRTAAFFAAVAFTLTPMILAYCVAGAITDMLNLWPYPLAIRAVLRGLRRPGWRDGLEAGVWAGLGVATCPYNFVIFSALVVPALPWAWTLWRHGGEEAAAPRPSGWQPLRALLGLCLTGGLIGGAAAWEVHRVMTSPDSQIPLALVEATRPTPPYDLLKPGEADRYTAYLSDYIAVGKQALVFRSTGSEYFRAFSPGLSLLLLVGCALLLHRRRAMVGLWVTMGAFAAVASTGPFLPLTGASRGTTPINPVWLGLHAAWPGAGMLQEPFRYAVPAALALAVAGAWGVAALGHRLGRPIGVYACALWLIELVVVSPVPAPLPTGAFVVDDAYAHLDDVLPPGPIIQLPYFDRGSDRFQRIHFLQALVHGRPIPDEVLGFPARYLKDNQFTASLLAKEKKQGRLAVAVTDRARMVEDRRRLQTDGFVGFVVDPSGFERPELLQAVIERLTAYSPPSRVGDLYVFPIWPDTEERETPPR